MGESVPVAWIVVGMAGSEAKPCGQGAVRAAGYVPSISGNVGNFGPGSQLSLDYSLDLAG